MYGYPYNGRFLMLFVPYEIACISNCDEQQFYLRFSLSRHVLLSRISATVYLVLKISVFVFIQLYRTSMYTLYIYRDLYTTVFEFWTANI